MQKRTKESASRRARSSVRSQLFSETLQVAFTEQQIQKRVRELARNINRDYSKKSIHVVAVLENCFMFVADLLRVLKPPVVCHFLNVQTTDTSANAVRVRELRYAPEVSTAGKEVLLVDGVFETGITLDYLYRYVVSQSPASVRTAILLEKTKNRKVDMVIDYLGFRTSDKYVVGYGLGFQDKYRNLPYMAALVEAG